MKTKRVITRCMMTAVAAGLMLAIPSQADAKPLKVFILAGQSNMEGPASIKTFDYLGDDPVTAPLLKQMRGDDGKPRMCDNVWISYLTGGGEKNFEITGKLTAGYGSMWGLDSKQPGDKIGPEFTFGLTMDAALAEPVLIIKAAWGGKSLHTDFRPPGAGPYQLNDYQKKLYYGPPGHGVPKDMDAWLAEKKREQVSQMRWFLDAQHKDHANADGKMTQEQKEEFMRKFEADLISLAEAALWKRGASNAGYHYLGCAKTFALMGRAFAQTNLEMMKEPRSR